MSEPAFLGTARYELRRTLGAGSSGVVYEAWDAELGCPVAIKTLHGLDPDALLRLKREFRELADIAHPNLVTLHALVSAGSQPLLVMELIDGERFLTALRGDDVAPEDAGSSATYSDTRELPVDDFDEVPAAPRGWVPGTIAPDLDRLRDAFRQLAEGVQALHATGRLHRDLKPSNVLISSSGRVVILDFGLVSDVHVTEVTVAGSVGYMAPEQAQGRALGPACDWYAVGTMLFEALTGQRPFMGPLARVLADKQAVDPPAPSELCPEVPPDLDRLCRRMLARDPRERPTGAEILAALGGSVVEAAPTVPLVGRGEALEALHAAWARVRDGNRPVLVRVRGRSGFGKSTLIEHFLASLPVHARVLAGRCYERESVPYKALDALADGLVEDFDRMAEAPAGADALVELFPVFRRVKRLAELPPCAIPDANERRERGYAALIDALVASAPAVVFVDDVHWGDADSVSWFAHLMQAEAPLLVVLAWRDDEEDTPFLRALEGALLGVDAPQVRVDLDRLSSDHATALARELLPDDDPQAAQDIAAAGQGNPMFVYELARHRAATGELGQVIDLDAAIRWRVSRLPDRARALLELVVVAGRPTPLRLLQDAGDNPDAISDVAGLRVGRLVRTSGEQVSPYHDRVREAVLAQLGQGAASRHRALARALTRTAEPDPELLAFHLSGAGDRSAARPLLIVAAERAAAAMAFDHAAGLYRQVLDAGDDPDRSLRTRLGSLLAFAGRAADAAEVWLDAAEAAEAAEGARLEAVALRQKAGEHLLAAGHVDRGLTELGRALRAVGLSMPPTGDWALLELLPRMAWIRLRGTRFAPRTTPLDPIVALQIDLCWSGVNGLAYIDRYRSATFQARQLMYALSAGDPARVSRCLAVEGAFAALGGGAAGEARATALHAQARELLASVDDPELHALELYCRAVAHDFVGKMQEGLALADASEALYRSSCAHVAEQVIRTGIVQVWMLTFLGDFPRLAEVFHRVRREARRTGNHYAHAAVLYDGGWMVFLSNDDPDGADAALGALGPFGETTLPTYAIGLARAYVHLYRGQGDRAAAVCAELDRRFRRTMLNTMQLTRLYQDVAHVRARLVIAESTADPGPALREADRLVRQIAAEDIALAPGLSALYEGRMLELRGDRDGALAAYARADAGLAAIGWIPHQQAARWKAGALRGGPEGADLVAAARDWFCGIGVVDPGRLAAFLVGAAAPLTT